MPSPMTAVDTVTTILTFILLISNFILMIIMWVDKARTPEKNQTARILKLEERVDDLYERMDHSKEHIAELEKSNVLTQESLLALLSHAIDGNNTKGLTDARNNLQRYLTHRGVQINN